MKGKGYKQDNKTAMEAARKELAAKIVQVGAKLLTNLEKEVLTQVLINGKSYAEIADSRELTGGRIKQIFEKGIRRLNHFLNSVDERMVKYLEVIEKYETLKIQLTEYEKKEEEANKKKNILESFSPEIRKLLQTKIEDTNLSARVKNVCQKGDVFGHNTVETVTDLVRLSPKKFLSFRNSGKKSLIEIEGFLSKNALKWGMLENPH